MAGVLIALEGIDGCGKSTQAALLLERLKDAGVPVGPAGSPGVVREPGATPAGERIRDLLLHESGHIEPWAEALLYAAARAQLAGRVLRPALDEGLVVVLDRYVDSSLAYQGWARGLGVSEVFGLNMLATGRLLPALTVVLRIPVDEAVARWSARRDRIEAEGRRFQAKVAKGYEHVLDTFPNRVVAVEATGEREQIADRVWALVAPLLAARGFLAERVATQAAAAAAAAAAEGASQDSASADGAQAPTAESASAGNAQAPVGWDLSEPET